MVVTKASMEGKEPERPTQEDYDRASNDARDSYRALKFLQALRDGSLKLVAAEVHHVAKSKGWHIHDRTFGDVVALIHTEVSEAMEEHRAGHRPTQVRIGEKIYNDPDGADWDEMELIAKEGLKPEGLGVELADAIIRILDYADEVGLDMDELIRIKTAFNRTRPYRHGGKVL